MINPLLLATILAPFAVQGGYVEDWSPDVRCTMPGGSDGLCTSWSLCSARGATDEATQWKTSGQGASGCGPFPSTVRCCGIVPPCGPIVNGSCYAEPLDRWYTPKDYPVSRTVGSIASQSCSSKGIVGLSQQILMEMVCGDEEGLFDGSDAAFVSIADLEFAVDFLDSMFPFMQENAAEALEYMVSVMLHTGSGDLTARMRLNHALRDASLQYLMWRFFNRGCSGYPGAADPYFNNRGGSNHMAGLAVDVSAYNAGQTRAIRHEADRSLRHPTLGHFDWFGSRDRPHFTYKPREGETALEIEQLAPAQIRAMQRLYNRNAFHYVQQPIEVTGVWTSSDATAKALLSMPAQGYRTAFDSSCRLQTSMEEVEEVPADPALQYRCKHYVGQCVAPDLCSSLSDTHRVRGNDECVNPGDVCCTPRSVDHRTVFEPDQSRSSERSRAFWDRVRRNIAAQISKGLRGEECIVRNRVEGVPGDALLSEVHGECIAEASCVAAGGAPIPGFCPGSDLCCVDPPVCETSETLANDDNTTFGLCVSSAMCSSVGGVPEDDRRGCRDPAVRSRELACCRGGDQSALATRDLEIQLRASSEDEAGDAMSTTMLIVIVASAVCACLCCTALFCLATVLYTRRRSKVHHHATLAHVDDHPLEAERRPVPTVQVVACLVVRRWVQATCSAHSACSCA
eukprot:CAMPEP_0170750912 /NCGR_PEP_ID=MMETSP0437-20130122/11178_1 /TAXON_ID=0 /ORGANISM="Sexangularia sp." /LENGTH=681 /DNA_ID=CAMNT_0011089927 /DNA_START=46 /DNA_END=2088 /DNA_ORIENTATION=-